MAKHNGVYRTGGVWCSATSLGIVFVRLTADKGCIGDVTNDFNATTFVKLIGLEADPLWFGEPLNCVGALNWLLSRII